MMSILMITARAPVNIAVIKYWGKRDEDLILPINDSMSVTLSKDQMCATTTVACSPAFESDKMWLNGKEQDTNSPRLKNCIREVKKQAVKMKGDSPFLQWSVHINSRNNFPTAAGLASSAAGYACLVFALGALYEVDGNLSAIARQGSGSACRSMYGGFVQWHKGMNTDGSDSIAQEIAPKEQWPELRVIVLVVNDREKETSSTNGMKQSTQTSDLIMHRANSVVPSRIKDVTKAIMEKDFHLFSEITMKDSNQFHAICLDTYPPIRYLSSTSFAIIELVHTYNAFYGQNKVAYTFDAGPNACLYLLEKDVDEVIGLLTTYFPFTNKEKSPIHGLPAHESTVSKDLLDKIRLEPRVDALRYIINSKVGSGPELIKDPSQHLLDVNGEPR